MRDGQERRGSEWINVREEAGMKLGVAVQKLGVAAQKPLPPPGSCMEAAATSVHYPHLEVMYACVICGTFASSSEGESPLRYGTDETRRDQRPSR